MSINNPNYATIETEIFQSYHLFTIMYNKYKFHKQHTQTKHESKYRAIFKRK